MEVKTDLFLIILTKKNTSYMGLILYNELPRHKLYAMYKIIWVDSFSKEVNKLAKKRDLFTSAVKISIIFYIKF